MEANLNVTFYDDAEQREYQLELRTTLDFVYVLARRSQPGFPFRTADDEAYSYTIIVEDLYNWIRHDPMGNPGGFYGMLFYCTDKLDAPLWLRKFCKALV